MTATPAQNVHRRVGFAGQRAPNGGFPLGWCPRPRRAFQLILGFTMNSIVDELKPFRSWTSWRARFTIYLLLSAKDAAQNEKPMREFLPIDAAMLLTNATKVIIVPGYGLAVSQATPNVLLSSLGIPLFSLHFRSRTG